MKCSLRAVSSLLRFAARAISVAHPYCMANLRIAISGLDAPGRDAELHLGGGCHLDGPQSGSAGGAERPDHASPADRDAILEQGKGAKESR